MPDVVEYDSITSQCALNRLRISVVWSFYPELNVRASCLGVEGIRITFRNAPPLLSLPDADISSETYLLVEMEIYLLRTQKLAAMYKSHMERSNLLGLCSVRTDSVDLGIYQFIDCSIRSIGPLIINGDDVTFVVTISGRYLINTNPCVEHN